MLEVPVYHAATIQMNPSVAADWLIRTCLPTWLRAAGLIEDAEALSGLACIDNREDAGRIRWLIERSQENAPISWRKARRHARETSGNIAELIVREAMTTCGGEAAKWSARGFVASSVWSSAFCAGEDAARTIAWEATRKAVRSRGKADVARVVRAALWPIVVELKSGPNAVFAEGDRAAV